MEGAKTVKGSEIIGRNVISDASYRFMIYDFKRPDKFSKDQIRTLSIMHETFARLLTTYLSATLRKLAQVHVHEVDQMTFQEFLQAIPSPATLAVVDMSPLKGSAIVEVDPQLTFSIIDRMFGGAGNNAGFTRGHTDIETVVLEGVILQMLRGLKEAWSNLIELEPTLGAIEFYPLFTQIVPPSEMVVLVVFQVKIGEQEGMINLGIPYLTIEPLIPRLSAAYWYSAPHKERKRRIPAGTLENVSLAAEVFFEAESLSLKDLAHLKKNTLVRLGSFERGEAFLAAGDYPVIRLKKTRVNVKNDFEFVVETSQTLAAAGGVPLFLSEESPAEREGAHHRLGEQLDGLKLEMRSQMQEINRAIADLRIRQDELLDQIYPGPHTGKPELLRGPFPKKPFGFIGTADIDFLHTLIVQEHPQTTAMILSYLDANLSAYILSKLDETARTDIVERIASMDRIPPEILKKVETVMEEKITAAGADEYSLAGGVETAAQILNLASRSVEKQIIDSLQYKNPRLAGAIKAYMFVFEDIMLLENEAIQTVLKNVERRDLVVALKAADERVKEKIFGLLSAAERSAVQNESKGLGKLRLSDVEAAQQRIVNVIRTLEESGTISVDRELEPKAE